MAAGTHFSGTDTRSSSGDTFSLSCSPCHLCPRDCGADRAVSPGYCGQLDAPTAARAALHHWEEPCIDVYKRQMSAIAAANSSTPIS